MFFSVCDTLYRAVILLCLAIAPFAAPLEASRSTTMAQALTRLGVAAALTACVVAAVRWAARRVPAAALLTMITWLALVTCAALFSHDDGPVMKALPLAAPLT